MERRIKLSNDDLMVIADVLEDARDSAIPQHTAYIEQVARLEAEFRSRADAEVEE